MHTEHLVERAAEPVLRIIDAIRPDQLGAPTPCAEYDVADLVRHLLFWGPALEGAGRKEQVVPEGVESDVDLDGWQDRLKEQLRRTASAWGTTAAWAGTTHMGSPHDMPAALVGGMVAGEIAVHGWDFARSIGVDAAWDDDLLAFLHGELTAHAEMGREMGVYGPEVPVPADAPLLDRVVALTGRQP
ncbi:TIGR03086 family metal-binding protein [Saccharothrix obliqua]|uniref:TIGR03086 family metal-binding protein n=1 Tax=Saccharothrix obliqua TaxID=2861747 RepID=UPI001C600D2A|nr:TIGR03086 family metal-binding protein [Saccharothrix obliqua]MBW4716397.1 TIGR03086 family protein [Saccharothrix obliqua]